MSLKDRVNEIATDRLKWHLEDLKMRGRKAPPKVAVPDNSVDFKVVTSRTQNIEFVGGRDLTPAHFQAAIVTFVGSGSAMVLQPMTTIGMVSGMSWGSFVPQESREDKMRRDEQYMELFL